MNDTFTAYISYDEYVDLGGKVSSATFPLLEKKAQRYLDTWTQERIKSLDSIPDEVKEVLTIMIDTMSNNGDGQKLTSFSNGKVSMSFDTSKTEEMMLYDTVILMLPLYLTSRVVD